MESIDHKNPFIFPLCCCRRRRRQQQRCCQSLSLSLSPPLNSFSPFISFLLLQHRRRRRRFYFRGVIGRFITPSLPFFPLSLSPFFPSSSSNPPPQRDWIGEEEEEEDDIIPTPPPPPPPNVPFFSPHTHRCELDAGGWRLPPPVRPRPNEILTSANV